MATVKLLTIEEPITLASAEHTPLEFLLNPAKLPPYLETLKSTRNVGGLIAAGHLICSFLEDASLSQQIKAQTARSHAVQVFRAMQFQADEFETVMPAKFIMYFFGILSASPDASAPVTPVELAFVHRVVVRSGFHNVMEDLFASRDEQERSIANSLDWLDRFSQENFSAALERRASTLLTDELLRAIADVAEYFFMCDKYDKAKRALEQFSVLSSAVGPSPASIALKQVVADQTAAINAVLAPQQEEDALLIIHSLIDNPVELLRALEDDCAHGFLPDSYRAELEALPSLVRYSRHLNFQNNLKKILSAQNTSNDAVALVSRESAAGDLSYVFGLVSRVWKRLPLKLKTEKTRIDIRNWILRLLTVENHPEEVWKMFAGECKDFYDATAEAVARTQTARKLIVDQMREISSHGTISSGSATEMQVASGICFSNDASVIQSALESVATTIQSRTSIDELQCGGSSVVLHRVDDLLECGRDGEAGLLLDDNPHIPKQICALPRLHLKARDLIRCLMEQTKTPQEVEASLSQFIEALEPQCLHLLRFSGLEVLLSDLLTNHQLRVLDSLTQKLLSLLQMNPAALKTSKISEIERLLQLASAVGRLTNLVSFLGAGTGINPEAIDGLVQASVLFVSLLDPKHQTPRWNHHYGLLSRINSLPMLKAVSCMLCHVSSVNLASYMDEIQAISNSLEPELHKMLLNFRVGLLVASAAVNSSISLPTGLALMLLESTVQRMHDIDQSSHVFAYALGDVAFFRAQILGPQAAQSNPLHKSAMNRAAQLYLSGAALESAFFADLGVPQGFSACLRRFIYCLLQMQMFVEALVAHQFSHAGDLRDVIDVIKWMDQHVNSTATGCDTIATTLMDNLGFFWDGTIIEYVTNFCARNQRIDCAERFARQLASISEFDGSARKKLTFKLINDFLLRLTKTILSRKS